MALPKYNEMYNIFLEEISDGKPHVMAEIQQNIAQRLRLTEEESGGSCNVRLSDITS